MCAMLRMNSAALSRSDSSNSSPAKRVMPRIRILRPDAAALHNRTADNPAGRRCYLVLRGAAAGDRASLAVRAWRAPTYRCVPTVLWGTPGCLIARRREHRTPDRVV